MLNGNANLSIQKIENGYQVYFNKQVKAYGTSGTNLYDYVSKTYAFTELTEALAKVEELSKEL